METLITLGVVTIGAVALIAPFLVGRPGALPFEPQDVERVSGPRTGGTLFSAAFLLVLMSLAIYVEVIQGDYWLAFDTTLIVVLMAAVLAPEGRVGRACLKVLEYQLVAVGLTVVLAGLAEFFVAATRGQALLPRARGIWVSATEEPFIFWYSIAAAGLVVFAVLYSLREYFARAFEHRTAAAATNHDSPPSLVESSHPAHPRKHRYRWQRP